MILEIITVTVLAVLAVCIMLGIHNLNHTRPPEVDVDSVIDQVMDRLARKTIGSANIDFDDEGIHIFASAYEERSELTPCTVHERKGLFHRWTEQDGRTYAIVEEESGNVILVTPTKVRFTEEGSNDNREGDGSDPEGEGEPEADG